MQTCKYCDGINLFHRQSGAHVGLYCADCDPEEGKWLQWVKQTKEYSQATEEQEKYARHLLNTWRVSKMPMSAEEAGAIIGGFKRRWGGGKQ